MVEINDLIRGGSIKFRPVKDRLRTGVPVDGAFKPIYDELIRKYPDLPQRIADARLEIKSSKLIFHKYCKGCDKVEPINSTKLYCDACATANRLAYNKKRQEKRKRERLTNE